MIQSFFKKNCVLIMALKFAFSIYRPLNKDLRYSNISQSTIQSASQLCKSPEYKSIDRSLFQCTGNCGNTIAQLIDLCISDPVKKCDQTTL